MGDEFLNKVRLQSQFPIIYRTVMELGLRFVFENSSDCNLTLVREFYDNWLTEMKYKTVPIRGKDVKFSARILNEFLGTSNCDTNEFNSLKYKPPYRDIQHTLCEVESTTRWERSKDTRRHNTLHFANFNQVARVWLKIVCSMLLPAKHLSEVTRERVVLVYMLMKEMSITVGAILRQSMMKFRNNLRWRFWYGGLITHFLRAEGIEEEPVDMIVAYHPDLTGKIVHVTRTKALDTSHGPVLLAQERQPRDDRRYGQDVRHGRVAIADRKTSGPSFLEPLDDDEATVDETMGDEEDVVDG
uniref:Putative plant transposon protein domain-containing protein n=1 Tax=Solanum tuberosum TaxID=4113 RepID=M1DJB3_SOLTU